MRLAIIADIHGNHQALTAVLDDLSGKDISGIISLGDVVGYGPEPDEVVSTLITHNIHSVMGNHELALADERAFKILNPVSQRSLVLTRELLSPKHLDWLTRLPIVTICHEARFLHGCPPASPTQYLFDPSQSRLKKIFSSYPEQICFAGHTHLLSLFTRTADGIISTCSLVFGNVALADNCRYLFVCGSVGQPRDNQDNRAKYGIWDTENNCVEINAVAYDVEATVRLLKARGFPASNAQRLL